MSTQLPWFYCGWVANRSGLVMPIRALTKSSPIFMVYLLMTVFLWPSDRTSWTKPDRPSVRLAFARSFYSWFWHLLLTVGAKLRTISFTSSTVFSSYSRLCPPTRLTYRSSTLRWLQLYFSLAFTQAKGVRRPSYLSYNCCMQQSCCESSTKQSWLSLLSYRKSFLHSRVSW